MGNTHDAIAEKLTGIAGYHALAAKAFGSEEMTIDRTAQAIACFERTVLSGNAPYDRYKKGDKKAMTPEQVRGMSVFIVKAKCDQCHEGANFTLNAYANPGGGSGQARPRWWPVRRHQRSARLRRVQNPDAARDRTHPPYMHDGRLQTLELVVDF